MTELDPFRDWDAAYVLGALSAADRREYEDHLRTCDYCRGQVAELAVMPGLLGRVSAADAIALHEPDTAAAAPPGLSAPATLLPSMLRAVRRRRRRARAIAAGALVAVAAALAALFLVPALRADSNGVALDQVVASPIHARIRLTAQSWGTKLEVDCHYDEVYPARAGGPTPSATATSPSSGAASGTANGTVPPRDPGAPRSYSLVITDRNGDVSPGLTWTAAPGSTVDPTGATKIRLAQIAKVELLGADGRVLLRLVR